ncbi:hypothetical protein [Nocardia sp. NPDC057668]|uniref:hypothetical protein n=1 Tax=Nocardia sp. NPDC057668 TaxID=3346202 RepID=UPI00366B48C2
MNDDERAGARATAIDDAISLIRERAEATSAGDGDTARSERGRRHLQPSADQFLDLTIPAVRSTSTSGM